MPRMTQTQAAKKTGRDLTKGSIIGNLLSLSGPMIATESIYTLSVLEMVWVGRLGAAALAGVGIAFIVVMLILTAQIGLSVAARAMIARAIGAGNEAEANHVARQGIFLAVSYGLVMTVVGVTLAGPILRVFNLEPDATAAGITYLRVFSLAWIPASFYLMTYGMIQASGDSVNPMKIELAMRLTQVVVTPFLVLGWAFFPKVGVGGAAMGGAAAEYIGMSLAIWLLTSGRTRLHLGLKGFRPDFEVIRRLIRVGLPASVMNIQLSVSSIVIAGIMVPFGTAAVAGHSLLSRIQQMLFLPNFGLSLGAGVLVGQNLGAREPGRAQRTGWTAAGLAGGLSFTLAVAVLVWANSIARVFVTDPQTVALTATFLRIAAVAIMVSGVSSALQQSINGAGDTMIPMIVGVLTVWALQIPLAFLLPRFTSLGVFGVRWAMVSTYAAGALIYMAYFKSGRWKRTQV